VTGKVLHFQTMTRRLHDAGGHKGGVNFSDGIQASDLMGLMGKGGSGACCAHSEH
jgi:hypothetical protein